MRNAIIMIGIVLGSMVMSVPARGEELTAEKRADIKYLLELTGSLKIGRQMSEHVVTRMTEMLKKTRPEIPAEMYDVMKEEVSAVIEENLDGYMEIIIPIYHKYFTHAELKQLLAFYQTDIGKKTIEVTPILVNEGIKAGTLWGNVLAPIIQRRLRERFKRHGYEISA